MLVTGLAASIGIGLAVSPFPADADLFSAKGPVIAILAGELYVGEAPDVLLSAVTLEVIAIIKQDANAQAGTAETNVVPTLGPPQNTEWAIGLTCNSNIPGSFVTSIDLDQTLMFGGVRNVPGKISNIVSIQAERGRFLSPAGIDAKSP